jgi:hypothetical protein
MLYGGKTVKKNKKRIAESKRRMQNKTWKNGCIKVCKNAKTPVKTKIAEN